MSWPFGHLTMFGYDVVVADPPWDFENYSDKGTRKGADPHYRVQPLAWIKALPVGQLVRSPAILLLWCTAPMLKHGFEVMEEWGFPYVSKLEWRKITKNDRPRIGTGYRVRTMSEPILLGAIGAQFHKPFPSIFDGVAREHSRKPEEFYDLVRKCTPDASRCDLFSRANKPGFVGWGDEHGKLDGGG
jgi:N6-adenosine-specific RNA methylase IME4